MNTRYLNTVLTVIALLLALNFWVGAHQSPASAMVDPAAPAHAAGRTDAGQQRAAMIDAIKKLDTTVDAMNKKLSDGSVKVIVTSMPDKD